VLLLCVCREESDRAIATLRAELTAATTKLALTSQSADHSTQENARVAAELASTRTALDSARDGLLAKQEELGRVQSQLAAAEATVIRLETALSATQSSSSDELSKSQGVIATMTSKVWRRCAQSVLCMRGMLLVWWSMSLLSVVCCECQNSELEGRVSSLEKALEKEKASSASAAAEAEKSMAALRWMLVGGSDGSGGSAAGDGDGMGVSWSD
jgi:hypothetical protein